MKYEPTIAHNNYYIYNWTFSDKTTYNVREVTKSNYKGLTGSLKIIYIGPPLYIYCTTTKRIFASEKE